MCRLIKETTSRIMITCIIFDKNSSKSVLVISFKIILLLLRNGRDIELCGWLEQIRIFTLTLLSGDVHDYYPLLGISLKIENGFRVI